VPPQRLEAGRLVAASAALTELDWMHTWLLWARSAADGPGLLLLNTLLESRRSALCGGFPGPRSTYLSLALTETALLSSRRRSALLRTCLGVSPVPPRLNHPTRVHRTRYARGFCLFNNILLFEVLPGLGGMKRIFCWIGTCIITGDGAGHCTAHAHHHCSLHQFSY